MNPVRRTLGKIYNEMRVRRINLENPEMIDLTAVHALRSKARTGANPLVTRRPSFSSKSDKIKNPKIAAALANDQIGLWSLDAYTINFLERRIAEKRPKAILEFGSGLSTICFSILMRELYQRDDQIFVYSIEENDWQIEKTEERLKEAGLRDLVALLHAPVTPLEIDGVSCSTYNLNDNRLKEFFGDARPDFVVIDGPSGGGNRRYGTVALTRDYLTPDAEIYLDDALRDGELALAQQWIDEGRLSSAQMYMIGNGLLYGRP